MKGLIYKDIQLFFRGLDKKVLCIAAVAIVLLMTQTGPYGGLLGSILLAMTVSIQNILIFSSDESAHWLTYQRSLPVSSRQVVAGKYLSVLCTLGVSTGGSVLLCLLTGVIHGQLSPSLLGLSVWASVVIPLLWTGLCLPLTYWFGFRAAQLMGMVVVVPLFFLVKFFEDGPGLAAMPDTLAGLAALASGVAAVVFAVSYAISVQGYQKARS